jgi:hypothetical protein
MNLLFELSCDPFQDDLAVQYARMALAVSVEHKVTMVFRSDAAVLAMDPFPIAVKELNYFDQERFLTEQEVDMYVDVEELTALGSGIKSSVKTADRNSLKRLYEQQDVIFRN